MTYTILIPAFILAVLVLVLGVRPIRRAVVSTPLMRSMQSRLPQMGETERIALEAGTVGWDGQLFGGRPDWRQLRDFPIAPLAEAEQAFLDGPTGELCAMLDDWRINQDRDLPPEVWDFIKQKGFLGLIIPKEFGGLGFSAHAHSAVVARLAGRSATAAVSVMVPNSLGPAELLLHYGTDAQRQHYLPRLARGEEIPCFALTEKRAGSDAAGVESRGIVCRGNFKGEPCTGIRLNFSKRYITLAPVATVIGLAFRLFDPDHLLGETEDVGITCALLPRDTPGISVGNRHDPLGIPFQNGPVHGEDVFVPLDFIIGGQARAGEGWRMLMESLAAGRGISLPAQAVAAAQLALRTASAYAVVREQFGIPIGRFEGIRERLARIAGEVYIMDAARHLAFGAVDAGERPSVISAIVKAWTTGSARRCVEDAMDIQAGVAICRGPGNILSRVYMAMPLGITVEGANILTRSLVVFGQGAIRCHPHLKTQMEAIHGGDVNAFDKSLFAHLAHVMRNAGRCLFSALGVHRWTRAAPVFEPLQQRQLDRAAACFALVADAALLTLGASLKRREYLSGRLADAFAWLFLASAVLKRFHDDGRIAEHRPVVEWACRRALREIHGALEGVLDNLPGRVIAGAVNWLAYPLGRPRLPDHDVDTDRIAEAVMADEDFRDALTQTLFIPGPDEPGLGILEAAFLATADASEARSKVRDARRDGRIDACEFAVMARQASEQRIITREELMLIEHSEALIDKAISVSDFEPAEYVELK